MSEQEAQGETATSADKDKRKAECPYCGGSLAKVPGRKTKCPHCGQFMFVRTRPKDKARVVVTKEEADKIEKEWSIVYGTHDSFVAEREEFERERERLRQTFGGQEASENDIKWGLLNQQLMEHGKRGHWGLYRNTRFAMAEILRKEVRLSEALQTYLEVCYLDLNGPRNVAGIRDPELARRFPPFDPADAFLAPGVLSLILRIIKKEALGLDAVGEMFLNHNARVGDSLRLPRSAAECWPELLKQLEEQSAG